MIQLTQFAAESPHVSLAAESIFTVGSIHITNAIILGVLGYVLLLWVFLYTVYVVKKNKKRNMLVKLIVWGYEALYATVEQVVGDKKIARTLAPLPITLFFFIITQYYLGILPFVGPITIDGTPLFRGFAADLNTTLGLAVVSLVAGQLYAIKVHGFFEREVKEPA